MKLYIAMMRARTAMERPYGIRLDSISEDICIGIFSSIDNARRAIDDKRAKLKTGKLTWHQAGTDSMIGTLYDDRDVWARINMRFLDNLS